MTTANNNTTKTKFQQKAKQNQDAYSKGSAKYAGGVAASSASHLRNSSGKSVGSAGAGLKQVPYEVKRRMQAMKTQERQNRHARWAGNGGADGGGGIKPAGYDFRMASMGVSNDYSQAANRFAQSMSPPKQSQAPKKPYGGYQSNNPTTSQLQSTDGSMGAGDTRSFNFNPEASSDYWSEQMGNPSVGQNTTPAYQAGQASADAANINVSMIDPADKDFNEWLVSYGHTAGEGTDDLWKEYQAGLNGYASGGKVNAYVSGGEVAGKGNIPTQPNGDDTLATLKTGEVVLTQEQQAALGGDEAMAQAGVPGFGGNKPADNSPIPAFNQGGLNSPFNFGSAPVGGGFGNTPSALNLSPEEKMKQLARNQTQTQDGIYPDFGQTAGLGSSFAPSEDNAPNTNNTFVDGSSIYNNPTSEEVAYGDSLSKWQDTSVGRAEAIEQQDADNITTAKNDWDKGFVEALNADGLDRNQAVQNSMDLENQVEYDRGVKAEAKAAEKAEFMASDKHVKGGANSDGRTSKDLSDHEGRRGYKKTGPNGEKGTLVGNSGGRHIYQYKGVDLKADASDEASTKAAIKRNMESLKRKAAKPRSKARTGGEGMYGGADSNNPNKFSASDQKRHDSIDIEMKAEAAKMDKQFKQIMKDSDSINEMERSRPTAEDYATNPKYANSRAADALMDKWTKRDKDDLNSRSSKEKRRLFKQYKALSKSKGTKLPKNWRSSHASGILQLEAKPKKK
jgi:hypothetical protein